MAGALDDLRALDPETPANGASLASHGVDPRRRRGADLAQPALEMVAQRERHQ